VKVGDLVRAVFMPLEPTGWYREMLDTGRPAVIIGHLDRDCNDAYAEIWYDGKPRFCAKSNLEVVK
jgi:hypothetical protein